MKTLWARNGEVSVLGHVGQSSTSLMVMVM
jgi:hypothetical protein